MKKKDFLALCVKMGAIPLSEKDKPQYEAFKENNPHIKSLVNNEPSQT